MTLALAFLKKNWLWLALAVAIAIAVVKIDANGAARATAQAERDKLRDRAIAQAIATEIGRKLDEDLAELARRTNSKISQIQREDRTRVQPIIQSELARDPTLLTRQCLTPELMRAINVSRGHPVGGDGQTADLGTGAPGVPGSTGPR